MVLRHVSILRDHPQGVCLYLAKVTELFKNLRTFKILKFLNNPVNNNKIVINNNKTKIKHSGVQ